jgi:hypothetical protein
MYDDEDDQPIMMKKPVSLRTVSWSENIEETELDIPGTPRTPRTSTTKGIARQSIDVLQSREVPIGSKTYRRYPS